MRIFANSPQGERTQVRKDGWILPCVVAVDVAWGWALVDAFALADDYAGSTLTITAVDVATGEDVALIIPWSTGPDGSDGWVRHVQIVPEPARLLVLGGITTEEVAP